MFALDELDFIVNYMITAKVGENYSNATDNSARFGYVVCKARTTKEALDNCEKAISLINIIMK